MKSDNKAINYDLLYTVSFILTFSLVFISFFVEKKSFIWRSDGLMLHYNFLRYMGSWLRGIGRSIINGDLKIKLWSFEFGYGSDLVPTLNARLGDPLNYVSVFVKNSSIEILHNILAVLRIYLAGISFSVYSRSHKNNNFETLIGCLSYCFCGLVLWVGVRHLYFINPMIYMPLIILGAEKIFDNKSGKLLVITIFLSAINYFYFFYMMSIIFGVYVLVLLVSNKKNLNVKQVIAYIFKYAKYYLLGVGLAAFLFIPVVCAFFGNGRLGVDYDINPFFRSINYYIEFIPRWFSQGYEYGEATGYIPLAVVAIVVLFNIDNFKKEKFLFVLGTIALLVPFFGWAMNGFAYITNRWIFAYSFLVSYIITVTIPYIIDIGNNIKAKYSLAIISVGLAFFMILIRHLHTNTFWSALVILYITVVLVCIILPYIKTRFSQKYKYISRALIFLLTILSLAYNGHIRFSENEENYISEYVDVNTSEEKLTLSPASSVKKLTNNSADLSDFYRIDENYNIMNTSVAQYYYGTQFYTGLLNSNVTNFHLLLNVGNAAYATTYNYKGCDRRTFLENFLNVKYYATNNKDTYIPYGFIDVTDDQDFDTGNKVYENSLFLPFGYTYKTYISESDFLKLSTAKKQEALLQSIVIPDDYDISKLDLTSKNNIYSDQNIGYSFICDEGISFEDNKIIVTDKNAQITFNFNGLPDSETYVSIQDFKFKPYKPDDETIFWEKPKTVNIHVGTENFSKSYAYRTPDDKAYTGIKDYFINTGYNESSVTWLTLRFSAPGEYSFSSLKIVCQPMTYIEDYISRLSESHMENVNIDTNTITGDISLDDDKILFLSVPYTNGWLLKVDGKSESIIQGNIIGLAIPLKAGEHHIELEYCTPGLKMGCLISCVTLVLVVLYEIIKKIRIRHGNSDIRNNN